METHDETGGFCPYYHHAVELIGRRWSGAILLVLIGGAVRFSEIAAAIRTALLAAFTLSSNARESYENSLNEHWAVAAAIRRRSPDEADHAMRQLLAGAARDLAPAYNRARPKQGSLRTATGVMSSSQRDRSSVQGRARQPKEERQ